VKIKKNILFTFDYELFLGENSGQLECCLIKPTEKILSILKKFDISSVFFVDTCYLLRFSNSQLDKHKKDFNIIKKQLISILLNKGYIFPHIHPHWIDAIYIEQGDYWNLSNLSKYRFSSISDEEKFSLFHQSIELIKSIQKEANIFYPINAYRAGGWCIQPFQAFEGVFKTFNIKYDLSVIPGVIQKTSVWDFDFRNVPKKSIYKFKNDIVQEDTNGQFLEITISKVNIPVLLKILNKIFLKVYYKLNKKSNCKGKSISVQIYESSFEKKLFQSDVSTSSIELLNIPLYPIYIDLINKNEFIHFISHPKMINTHNLFVFEKLLNNAFNKYDIETDFFKIIQNYEK